MLRHTKIRKLFHYKQKISAKPTCHISMKAFTQIRPKAHGRYLHRLSLIQMHQQALVLQSERAREVQSK